MHPHDLRPTPIDVHLVACAGRPLYPVRAFLRADAPLAALRAWNGIASALIAISKHERVLA